MQKVDFIPQLQHKLEIQKEEFRIKKEIISKENARLERRGLGELVVRCTALYCIVLYYIIYYTVLFIM